MPSYIVNEGFRRFMRDIKLNRFIREQDACENSARLSPETQRKALVSSLANLNAGSHSFLVLKKRRPWWRFW